MPSIAPAPIEISLLTVGTHTMSDPAGYTVAPYSVSHTSYVNFTAAKDFNFSVMAVAKVSFPRRIPLHPLTAFSVARTNLKALERARSER